MTNISFNGICELIRIFKYLAYGGGNDQMKKTKLIYLWFFFAYGVIVFTGCSNAIKLTKIEDLQGCSTTIEGNFLYEAKWEGIAPAILIWERGRYKALSGEIISQDSSGIIFDQEKQSPVFDPKPKYYAFNDIVLAVDQNGKIIAGKIPERLQRIKFIEILMINLASNFSNDFEFMIQLKPNQPFGFCIQPGNYLVKEIRFVDHFSNVDVNADSLDITFTIDKQRANYIGDIYIGQKPPQNIPADSINIEYKILSRPNDSAAANYLSGVLGWIYYESYINSDNVIGEHILWIANDYNHFEKKGKASSVKNLLNLNH